MLATEILRVVRHGVAPFVILAVEQGWLPAAAKKDAVEFIAIVLSFGLAYGWSWWNERRKQITVVDPEQLNRAVADWRADGGTCPVCGVEDPATERPEAG